MIAHVVIYQVYDLKLVTMCSEIFKPVTSLQVWDQLNFLNGQQFIFYNNLNCVKGMF